MGNLQVALSALLEDAEGFSERSKNATNIATGVRNTPSQISSWGLWAQGEAPFKEACTEVADMYDQGSTELQAISDNLRDVERIYREEEEAGVAASSGLI